LSDPKEYARAWRAKNKGKVAEYGRRKKAKNPGAVDARKRRWEKENEGYFKAWSKAYQAKYYQAHAGAKCADRAAKRAADVPRYLWQQAKTRAKRQGVPFDILPSDIVVPENCPVLGIPLSRNLGKMGPGQASPTLDKMVAEFGYVVGNITVISWRANAIKRDATTEEMEAIAKWMRSRHVERSRYTVMDDDGESMS
jgi:hypothetical protein